MTDSLNFSVVIADNMPPNAKLVTVNVTNNRTGITYTWQKSSGAWNATPIMGNQGDTFKIDITYTNAGQQGQVSALVGVQGTAIASDTTVLAQNQLRNATVTTAALTATSGVSIVVSP